MATGQMEGVDEYDFVVEIDIPDEVMMQKITNYHPIYIHLLLMKK